MRPKKVPIGISNRHVHVCRRDLDVLFGDHHQLNRMKNLKQPGQYAAEEKVDLVGPKGTLKNVRIIGPVREETQIEISFADSFVLGVKPPIRDSGDLDGSEGLKLVGPSGEVELKRGCIAAARHIHMTPDEANELGLKDKDLVNVRTGGQRSVVFENVLVRVNPQYALEMHVDLEEANSAGLRNDDKVEIIR